MGVKSHFNHLQKNRKVLKIISPNPVADNTPKAMVPANENANIR